jgi:hypothetical protein
LNCVRDDREDSWLLRHATPLRTCADFSFTRGTASCNKMDCPMSRDRWHGRKFLHSTEAQSIRAQREQ